MSTSIPQADREYYVRENCLVLVAELERGIKRRATTIRKLLHAKKCLRERVQEQADTIERLRAALENLLGALRAGGIFSDSRYREGPISDAGRAAVAALSGKEAGSGQ